MITTVRTEVIKSSEPNFLDPEDNYRKNGRVSAQFVANPTKWNGNKSSRPDSLELDDDSRKNGTV
ncbi:hypothetical protein J6590_007397, partial [Homalodisca vitripennis]